MDLNNKYLIYLLGFIWADGHVRKYEVSSEIKYSDFSNIKKIVECTNYNWKYSHRRRLLKQTNKYYEQGGFRLSSKSFATELSNYDFMIKSYTSPDKILNDIPNHLRHHFFRGYIDGDGSFSLYNNGKTAKFNISSTIEQDWSFIEELLDNIGIEHYKIHEYRRKTGNSSLVSIANKWDIIKLGDYLYKNSKNIRLERKYLKYIEIKNSDIKKAKPEWSDEDIEYLKNNYSKGVKYCSEQLNRSTSSIYGAVHLLDITNGYKKWTKNEEQFLIENHHKGVEWCAKKLDRKGNSVLNKWNKIKKIY